jgi:hypothetical protein
MTIDIGDNLLNLIYGIIVLILIIGFYYWLLKGD